VKQPSRVSPQFMAYWGRSERWRDPRVRDGKFYRKEGDRWVAVDNCGGEWFVEEFRRMKDAVGWLTDPEGRTGADWKAEVLHKQIGGGR
jgi:hypothetical protein